MSEGETEIQASRSPGYATRLADVLQRADAWVVRVAQSGYGIDISGHAPDHLRTVDKFLGERFRERLMQDPQRYPDAVIALGSYLGEVFVRSLDGWWHFPDSFQMIALYLSWNLAKRTECYCYVMVRGQRIYVFGQRKQAFSGHRVSFPSISFIRAGLGILKTSPFPRTIVRCDNLSPHLYRYARNRWTKIRESQFWRNWEI